MKKLMLVLTMMVALVSGAFASGSKDAPVAPSIVQTTVALAEDVLMYGGTVEEWNEGFPVILSEEFLEEHCVYNLGRRVKSIDLVEADISFDSGIFDETNTDANYNCIQYYGSSKNYNTSRELLIGNRYVLEYYNKQPFYVIAGYRLIGSSDWVYKVYRIVDIEFNDVY